jgi:hypothetical protein
VGGWCECPLIPHVQYTTFKLPELKSFDFGASVASKSLIDALPSGTSIAPLFLQHNVTLKLTQYQPSGLEKLVTKRTTNDASTADLTRFENLTDLEWNTQDMPNVCPYHQLITFRHADVAGYFSLSRGMLHALPVLYCRR